MNKTEIFIEKAIKIHGDRYDYSLVEYVKSNLKVKIICKEHGEFDKIVSSHLKGEGCPICSNSKMDVNGFIKKSILKHGNRYDYSLVNNIHSKIKVEIICEKHGIFEQVVYYHLNGQGCPKCSCVAKSTTDEFVVKSISIHGDRYDYSLVNYNHSKEKVKIICEKHGIYEQLPHIHLSGSGCSMCKSSKGNIKIMKYLKSNSIKFIDEHRFYDCKNILPLPFDFYLPEYNMCIEFDGRQHFEIIERFDGINSFNKVKINDNIKNLYCSNNNINLLRIPYWDFGNIENILNETLLKLII